jgi:GTPase SAR1 family protein
LEVRNEFYKETQGALLVYDATNRPSFEALGSWLQEAQQYGAPSNMVCLGASSRCNLSTLTWDILTVLVQEWILAATDNAM